MATIPYLSTRLFDYVPKLFDVVPYPEEIYVNIYSTQSFERISYFPFFLFKLDIETIC